MINKDLQRALDNIDALRAVAHTGSDSASLLARYGARLALAGLEVPPLFADTPQPPADPNVVSFAAKRDELRRRRSREPDHGRL
jgi:hypothetical protein